eukprot:1480949-Alexandrium_andersonii.AAC.1
MAPLPGFLPALGDRGRDHDGTPTVKDLLMTIRGEKEVETVHVDVGERLESARALSGLPGEHWPSGPL